MAQVADVLALVPEVTYRQLDSWVRLGVLRIEPTAGQGHFRQWTARDIQDIEIVLRLRAFGVPTAWLRPLLDALEGRTGWVLITPRGHNPNARSASSAESWHVVEPAVMIDARADYFALYIEDPQQKEVNQ